MNDPATAPAPNPPAAAAPAQAGRRAFAFSLITLVIDAMGIGLILPVMPDLITEIHGGSLGNAALWGGILATTFAVIQFLFGPIVGALSDRFGRRPVLLVTPRTGARFPGAPFLLSACIMIACLVVFVRLPRLNAA